VTGAASGIGWAIAAGLAADGFSVVVADLDEAKGRAAAQEIAASNQGRAIFQRVDVTKRASVSAAVDACARQFGSIKVMVNNAGFNKPEPFLEASEATWHKILDVNALGVMIGIQEAAKAPTSLLIVPANSPSSRSLTRARGRWPATASPSMPSLRVSWIPRSGSNSTRTSWRWG
jgi:NAD(P)-dependent dehydrogenase (short-subunit alcohol dehydrogenase family)